MRKVLGLRLFGRRLFFRFSFPKFGFLRVSHKKEVISGRWASVSLLPKTFSSAVNLRAFLASRNNPHGGIVGRIVWANVIRHRCRFLPLDKLAPLTLDRRRLLASSP